MTAITAHATLPLSAPHLRLSPLTTIARLATLSRRRFQLAARTPRELVVPLLTPILFALVIAPALKNALHTSTAYESFVAVGTLGLLIPLNTMFAGIGVISDRENGAQRELLAAPIPRALLVLSNLLVALTITALQVGVLIAVAVARGIPFHATGTGVIWFLAVALLFATAMYGAAETLAARAPSQEEYIGRVPVIAIVPWFIAGSLFSITALPIGLTWITRFLPLTHALALMRYGLLQDPSGLHNIWRMGNPTTMAALSLLVVAAFAALLAAVSVRVFTRKAVS
jgi:ABC-type multidrug transport system permease subunit